jgi:hypothetical protein
LVDYIGPDASHHQPIPFDFVNAPKYFIHDEEMGLDFGLVALREYYQRLLEKNNVAPFTEQDWRSPSSLDFEFYMMMGLPEQLIETTINMTGRTDPELKMYYTWA